MKKIILAISIVVTTLSYGQKQNYNWLFGTNNGLTWKEKEIKKVAGLFGTSDDVLTDLPRNLINPAMSTLEGTFTISDLTGNLILYSDGSRIFNKNNALITTGLGGNSTSAQSGSIVMYPESVDKYIAISAGYDNSQSTRGLFYAIIDMNLNNGLGGIPNDENTTTPLKHLPFIGAKGILGETVTAGRHSNRKDIWILATGRSIETIPGSETEITELYKNTSLNVWAINSDNASDLTNSVYSSYEIPGLITTPREPGGYIKFTNDTKHFAWINFGYRGNNSSVYLCYGDFDNTTGQISNVRIKHNIRKDITSFGYGVEFTNDNKYLYLTLAPYGTDNRNYTSHLMVYDFEALLDTTIETEIEEISPIKIFSTELSSMLNSKNIFYGALQSGPDGRIYAANLWKESILLIDNPKDPNNLRIYDLPTEHTTRYGLPNFAVPWFTTSIEINQEPNTLCANKSIPIDFYVVDGEGYEQVEKITINYGDGTSDTELTPLNPGIHSKTHTYKKPGIYNIKLNAYKADNTLFTSFDRDIIINSCAVKVNPSIRGEFKN